MTSKIGLIVIILVSIFLAFFVYPKPLPYLGWVPPFRLGLDLLGGVHLAYQADVTQLAEGQLVEDAMAGVRDVIERRVNLFGVSEPVVQIEGKDRLIVELAGITDVQEAIKLIGSTPFLEFRELRGDTASASFIPTNLT